MKKFKIGQIVLDNTGRRAVVIGSYRIPRNKKVQELHYGAGLQMYVLGYSETDMWKQHGKWKGTGVCSESYLEPFLAK